ncbi:MAG: hypothetical protein AAF485_28565, partial [Chloroflexota bacterium]
MRIVILTYESFYSNLMTERLLQTFPEQVVGIIRSDCLVYGKSLPKSFIHLTKHAGLRFVGRKAVENIQSRATAIFFQLIGRAPKVRSLREMKAHYNVPVIGATDVNHLQTLTQIEALKPDLVFLDIEMPGM